MISRREFLATGVASSLAFPGISPARTAGRPVSIGAYYYPWYDSGGRHWDQGYHGKQAGRLPALGLYSSRSPHTIRQHIEWSGIMGVDHWIASWWGPDSWEDHTLRHAILPMLERCGSPLKLCLFYEAEGLLGLDPERGIDFHPENLGRFSEHFRFLAGEYFSHPCYFRNGGRPVVYLYLSRAFRGDYAQGILQGRAAAEAQGFDVYLVGDEVYWGEPVPERIGLFDAITSYNMHGPAHFAGSSDWTGFLEQCQAVYEQYRSVAAGEDVTFVPGILPGFDSSDAGGDHYVIPETLRGDSGGESTLSAFAEMVKPLLDPAEPTVTVTSFNEWHEGTQLEPGRGGDVISVRGLFSEKDS